MLGAGLTLSHLADVFTRVGKGSPYFLELANLLTRTANLPVRNVNITGFFIVILPGFNVSLTLYQSYCDGNSTIHLIVLPH